jgi:primosomal protein N'
MLQTRRGGDDVLESLRDADFTRFMQDEVATAELLDLPPFGALAEIGGVAGPTYAAALRDAGVAVQTVGERFVVRAPTNGELRALLARAERPTGAMRLAIS